MAVVVLSLNPFTRGGRLPAHHVAFELSEDLFCGCALFRFGIGPTMKSPFLTQICSLVMR